MCVCVCVWCSDVIPTLHVWGQKDDVVPPALSKRLAELFPNSVSYEHHSGHVIPVNIPPKMLIMIINIISSFKYIYIYTYISNLLTFCLSGMVVVSADECASKAGLSLLSVCDALDCGKSGRATKQTNKILGSQKKDRFNG